MFHMRYTKWQVARGARADALTRNQLTLIKNVSILRATYQIRLLAFKAAEEGKKLVIMIPKRCQVHETLRQFVKEKSQIVRLQKV